MTETKEQQDAKLSEVFYKQMAFKNPIMQSVAVAIAQAAVDNPRVELWPDEPSILGVVEKLAPQDKNIVGSAWKWLLKVGILERTQQRRRSTAANSNGREIAAWRVNNYRLARTFLAHNGAPDPTQRELFR